MGVFTFRRLLLSESRYFRGSLLSGPESSFTFGGHHLLSGSRCFRAPKFIYKRKEMSMTNRNV